MRLFVLVVLLFSICAQPSQSWVYPEHRDIAVLAVMKLTPERRDVLDEIWNMARVGHEKRLPSSVVIGHLPPQPNYIDWAAWTAIGGDHSCSPQEMIDVVLNSDWILDVARITEEFKRSLANAKTHADRVNAIRDSDIDLQRADPNYVTRAGANNVHFLLPREAFNSNVTDYVYGSLVEGDEINALGVYYWYHYRALAKISRIRLPGMSQEDKQRLALGALADEAFGLHFLEDAFASGHVAGTWGNASLRKGTHDYYNEAGLETKTWGGKELVLMGDAHMSAEDAEAPAHAVRVSLMQLLDAYEGNEPYASHNFDPALFPGIESFDADTLNTCSNMDMPSRVASRDLAEPFKVVLNEIPVPALKSGKGALPRFRTELGGFIGISPFLRAGTWNGGFGPSQTGANGIGSLGMTIRVGLGLDGVTSESGDGLVFLEAGVLNDNPSTERFSNNPDIASLGDIASAIPARGAITTRLRMPFWLIPGDLILAGIFVAPFSLETMTQMAVIAGNGGLIPWQAGVATPIGRLQMVFGREVAVNFYGYTHHDNVLIPLDDDPEQNDATLVSMRSIQIEAPFVELRPFRTFSVDQSSSMVIQFYGAVDIPTVWYDTLNPGYEHSMQTIYSLGVRVAFDWRYYF